MKYTLIIILCFLVGAYTAGRFYSYELRTNISITADPERVWQQLTDFQQYPEWNPFVISIEGEAEAGKAILVLIDPPEGKTMAFNPKLLAVNENSELRWLGCFLVPGLFDGEHYFRISQREKGQVEFVHGEKFSGILAWLALPRIVDDTRAGFIMMNEALKRRLEQDRFQG